MIPELSKLIFSEKEKETIRPTWLQLQFQDKVKVDQVQPIWKNKCLEVITNHYLKTTELSAAIETRCIK